MISQAVRLVRTLIFWLYILFLYGPLTVIVMLSFQGPEGKMTFPIKNAGLHWFTALFSGDQRIGNFDESFFRSIILSVSVTALTMVISILAALSFRMVFRGKQVIFYLIVSSLIVPSILISFGIGIAFNIFKLNTGLFSSALGAQLTWTVPFIFLVLLGVFNRLDPRYEEASKDLGANDIQTFWEIILPLTGPTLLGAGILSFTLSYDEFARTGPVVGASNTLPVDIYGMTTLDTTPIIYAVGATTTFFSLGLILLVSVIMSRYFTQTMK